MSFGFTSASRVFFVSGLKAYFETRVQPEITIDIVTAWP